MTAADLSATDRAVLEQLLAGKHSKQIAGDMGLANNTIDVRMMRLKKRIGVRTLVQLGAWCERHGIREAGRG